MAPTNFVSTQGLFLFPGLCSDGVRESASRYQKTGRRSQNDLSNSNHLVDFKTLRGEYDICAISFALYPFVKEDFALLKTAVSFVKSKAGPSSR